LIEGGIEAGVEPARTSQEERYAMSRDTTVILFRQPEAIDDPLSEVAREGARRMLAIRGASDQLQHLISGIKPPGA
jgi:hypothetical protein